MFLLSTLFTLPLFCDCLATFNLDARQLYNFIDKTLMLKVVMDKGAESLVLTAPSGFGKSWSLEMFKTFLSINSDERLTTDLFKDTQILQDEDFVKANFRTHPVIYFSFKPDEEITDFSSLVLSFKKNLRKLFLEHNYLLDSPYLTKNDLEEFRNRASKNCPNCGPNGLYILSQMLFTHHKRKVILLIDDYDINIIDSIFSKDLDIIEVIRFYSTVLSTAIVYDPHIKLSVITGTSCTLLNLFPELEGAYKCVKFLHEKSLEPLFGLSESQVDSLFGKESFKSLVERRSDVKMWYNGFTGPDLIARTYNTRSVLSFLESGQLRIFWKVSKERPALRLLMHDVVSKCLFSGNSESVTVELQQNASLPEFKQLKHVVTTNGWDTGLTGLYVTVLTELGYFTFESVNGDGTAAVRMPNVQICEAVKAVVIESAKEAGRQAGQVVVPNLT